MARPYCVVVALLLLAEVTRFGEGTPNPEIVAKITRKGLKYGKGEGGCHSSGAHPCPPGWCGHQDKESQAGILPLPILETFGYVTLQASVSSS